MNSGQPRSAADHRREFAPTIFLGMCFAFAWIVRAVAPSNFWRLGLDAFLVIAAIATTLWLLHRVVPWQNVFAITTIILALSATAHVLAEKFKAPFVPPLFNESFAPLPPWIALLLWPVAIINARGIAQLILRSCRENAFYGFWLWGLASVAVGIFGSNPFDARRFLGHSALAAMLLLVCLPWFVKKKPNDRPPDTQALIVAILLLFW